jgi:hypothetical protein
MSLLVTSPLVSLYDPVSLVSPFVSPRILVNDTDVLINPLRVVVPTALVEYPDLNNDLRLQKKVYNNIWNILKDEWIYDYVKIFNYIVGTKNNYKLVSSLKEAEDNKNITEDMESKALWFLLNFYNKSKLASTIEKYRKKANINLWDIEKDDNTLKAFIYHQMKRMLFEKIA